MSNKLGKPKRNPLFESRGRLLDHEKVSEAFYERDALTLTDLAERMGFPHASAISAAFSGKAPGSLYRITKYLTENNIIPSADYSKDNAIVIKNSLKSVQSFG